MVKQLVISIFVGVILFNNSFSELLKIPSLFSHYQEHVSNNKNIAFLDFLEMHYGGDDLNNDDQERDMSLPFKKFQF